MAQSLIRKNQLHPDIADLVLLYGSGYFVTSGVFRATTSGIVYTTGDQTIFGNKIFNSNYTSFGDLEEIIIANDWFGSEQGLVSSAGEMIAIKYSDGSFQYGGAGPSSDPTTIPLRILNEITSFNHRPIVNGTGLLLSGDSNIIYTTGNQVISGVKTFRDNLNVSGSGNFNSGLYIKNSPVYSYGTFYDTGNYAISSTTSSYLMQFGSTGISNGITIGSTGSTDRSKIIIRDSGTYNLQFSSQVSNSENNVTNEITIWLKKNGVDEPWTTSIVSIPGLHSSITGRSIPSWNFFVNANTGDYFQLAYQGNSTNLSLNSVTGLTSPTRPNIPVNILTVNKVGY